MPVLDVDISNNPFRLLTPDSCYIKPYQHVGVYYTEIINVYSFILYNSHVLIVIISILVTQIPILR